METKRNKMLSVRASEEEIKRVKEIAAELMRTHHYLKESDVIRELIGFEDTGLITPKIRKRLLSDTHPTKQPNSSTPKVIRSSARKRDAIDEAIDAALAYGGKPVSDKDRKRIREILEKSDKEKGE